MIEPSSPQGASWPWSHTELLCHQTCGTCQHDNTAQSSCILSHFHLWIAHVEVAAQTSPMEEQCHIANAPLTTLQAWRVEWSAYRVIPLRLVPNTAWNLHKVLRLWCERLVPNTYWNLSMVCEMFLGFWHELRFWHGSVFWTRSKFYLWNVPGVLAWVEVLVWGFWTGSKYYEPRTEKLYF